MYFVDAADVNPVASHLAPRSIRINSVCPSNVNTLAFLASDEARHITG